MKKSTATASGQRQIIKSHLDKVGSCTTFYAREKLGIPHPAGRICELRQSGVNIKRAWIVENSSDGEPHRVAKYILVTTSKEAA